MCVCVHTLVNQLTLTNKISDTVLGTEVTEVKETVV
jgi:hypothetical protein